GLDHSGSFRMSRLDSRPLGTERGQSPLRRGFFRSSVPAYYSSLIWRDKPRHLLDKDFNSSLRASPIKILKGCCENSRGCDAPLSFASLPWVTGPPTYICLFLRLGFAKRSAWETNPEKETKRQRSRPAPNPSPSPSGVIHSTRPPINFSLFLFN